MVALRPLLGRGVGDAVGLWEQAVEMVETAICLCCGARNGNLHATGCRALEELKLVTFEPGDAVYLDRGGNAVKARTLEPQAETDAPATSWRDSPPML